MQGLENLGSNPRPLQRCATRLEYAPLESLGSNPRSLQKTKEQDSNIVKAFTMKCKGSNITWTNGPKIRWVKEGV